jgi:hypothetical protein
VGAAEPTAIRELHSVDFTEACSSNVESHSGV